jgi:hypothetical protein
MKQWMKERSIALTITHDYGFQFVSSYEERREIEEHPNYKVIMKIKSMQKKRIDNGYAF